MQNFDLNASGKTLFKKTFYTTFFFSRDSEELYEISGGINYEVGIGK